MTSSNHEPHLIGQFGPGKPNEGSGRASGVGTFISVMSIAVLNCLVTCGCAEDGGVTWLPDSSGFLYATGNGITAVHHYDVLLDSWHTIVPDSQSYTTMPGLSTDGSKLAIAELSLGQTDVMRIRMYDMAGRCYHTSEKFTWSKAGSNRGKDLVFSPCRVYWCPQSPHLMIETKDKLGIYNYSIGVLNVIDGEFHIPSGFNPIRPDGVGFVALEAQNQRPLPVFIKWDSTKTVLGIQSDTINQSDKEQSILEYRWRNSVLLCSLANSVLEIDTDSNRLTRIERKSFTMSGANCVQVCPFAGERAALKVLSNMSEPSYGYSLEYVNEANGAK